MKICGKKRLRSSRGGTYLPRDLFMRFIFPTIAVFFLTPLAALAGGEAEAGLPLPAAPLWSGLPITNSMLMVWLAVGLITLFCRAATKQMALVPAGFQNFAEWVVESLYDFLSSILGSYMVKKTFWFFGSIFLFILVSNLLGLIPGVGTIGRYNEHGHIIGFLRGGNADLNMTLAMALIFAVMWFYWALTENGVGVLEIISIAIRPVALTFRLFGNIYGGEQTMEKLMELVPKSLAFLPALPFYFMELLVGFVQALVFMLLTAVFLRLICEHAGDEHH